jgi:hypothetical protein
MGVDENTALVVDGDLAHVVGVSGVVLVDGSTASGGGGEGEPPRGTGFPGIRGMTVHLLGEGDAYHLGRREVIPAARGTITPVGPEPGSSGSELPAGGSPGGEGDVFARWTFLRALWELSLSAEASMDFQGEGYTLLIRKGPGFGWRARGEEGVQGVGEGFGAGPFLVDLLPSGGE